ncbi:MAG: hypothetical protein JXR07_08135 [Reichenbachiella sp.]
MFNKISIGILSAIILSCTYGQNPPTPLPPSSDETTNLEAVYTTNEPNTINAQYWNTADYIQIQPQEQSKGNVFEEDGLLNMTGLYNGLPDFNDGDSSAIRIKAAFDDTYLYILAEWTDQTYNISQSSWVYNAARDPYKPTEDTAGWTSQFNDDNFVLSFPMGDNKKDIWKWSFALSEPIGYAIDMVNTGSGEMVDDGDIILMRNSNGSGNRTGPAFEWDGVDQEINRPLSENTTFLDPAFYLVNKTPFLGDVVIGEVIYQAECSECHGITGDGQGWDWNTNESLLRPSLNRKSRTVLDDIMGSDHQGSRHWNKLDDQEKTDLLARLRGFSGVPGYYIENESANRPDVQAVSSEPLGRIDYNSRSKGNYSLLLRRALNTGKSDDIQFDLSQSSTYNFDVFLTDNDDPNRVGSEGHILEFKQ